MTLHEVGFHFTKVGEAGIADLTAEEVPLDQPTIGIPKLNNEGYHFTWYDQLPEELL